LINSTTSLLQKLRENATDWEEIWTKAVTISTSNNITIVQDAKPADGLRRKSRVSNMPAYMNDYFTMETVGARNRHVVSNVEKNIVSVADAKGEFRTSVLLVVLDRMLAEIERRFGPLQSKFYVALQALQPSSEHFLSFTVLQPMIEQYKDFLFPTSSNVSSLNDALSTELNHAKLIIEAIKPKVQTLHGVVAVLLPLKAAFPRLLAVYQVALTLPVSTASCERSFSCAKRVKTYLRTSMGDARFSSLGMMSIESDLTQAADFLDNVVSQFRLQAVNSGTSRRIAL